MKKRKTSKRTCKKTSNSMKCKKMSLKEKEFVAITVLAVFVFVFLLAVQNVPQENVTITGQAVSGLEDIDTSAIGQFLTNIMDPTKADATVFKWFLFFTFAIGIWGILSLFFEKGKGGLIKLLSLPAAFAMVYLLNIDEILATFLGYTALGMAAIVMLPFVGIVFFSIKLLERKVNAAKIVTQLLIWFVYICFMIYFFFRMIFFTPEVDFSIVILIINLIGVLAAIMIIIKNKPWRKWIAELGREGVGKAIEDVGHAVTTKERTTAEGTKYPAGGAWYNR